MQRRDFLKYSVALGVASALPLWSRAVFAAERPTLPIPDLLTTDARNRIQLTIGAGQSTFGGKTATTWGYNGNLLGPAVKLQRGKAVTVDIYNQLMEETTLHWHGLEVPGEVDGGPQGIIPPGGKRSVTLNVDQPAATCWFHPHQHGKTGRQVAMGLAGLVVIEDDEILKLMLPKQWGIDDVPVIVQDKKFNADGQIDYQLDVMTAAVGWFGDTLLTNGVIYPQHAAPRGWLRLRLLNGCNARSLNFATSDNRPLYVIASDGGLLPEPVKVNELPVLMGERFEVLVEVNDNKPFDLVTLPVSGKALDVMPVMDEEFVFIASQAQQDAFRHLTPEVLHAQSLIAFESGSSTRTLIDGWFAASRLTIAPVMQLGSIEAIKRMVRVGLGYSIVPGMAVAHEADREGLCVMSLTPMLQRQLAIVMRQDKILSKGIAGIIRLVQNHPAG